MVFESMRELLKSLLQLCLIEGTRVRESGLIVSIEKLSGNDEIILFFHTDSDLGRTCLKMKEENVKCCDYLVLYTGENSKEEIMCFLELKGKKAHEAAEQVKSAYMRMKELSQQELNSNQHQHIIQCVSICMHGRAPSPRYERSARDLLEKIFGKDNIRIKHGVSHDKELGTFLRKLHTK